MRALLSLLVVLCAAPLCAAPAPPPPKLTRDLLVGLWVYKYGSMDGGFLNMTADGRYQSAHSSGHEFVPRWMGLWFFDGEVLTLLEWGYPGPDDPPEVRAYEFRVTNRHYPAVAGVGLGCADLLLTDPRR